MESFFKALKVERIYQTCYETRSQACLDIVDWIEGFYNRQRLHTASGYLTPVDYEAKAHGCTNCCAWKRGRVNLPPRTSSGETRSQPEVRTRL